MEVEKHVEFIGPAKLQFDTFENQAAYFLDTFCQDWRNYENPRSHMIPRVFNYKAAEIDDQIIERIQNSEHYTSSENRLMRERISDQAEHIMYKAINRLIDERVAGPFVAIHNLTIDQRRVNILNQIYPSIVWEKAEYDFVLVGMRIGIIAVEVKSSRFLKNSDILKKPFRIPDLYRKGIDQLDRMDGLIRTISQCTGMKFDCEQHVRKILFAPNLERSRYERWKSSHHAIDRSKVHLIFKEDMEIDEVNGLLSSVTESFKSILTNLNGIPAEIYESFAKILTAISSIRSTGKNQSLITIDSGAYSQSIAIARESDRIRKQQPREGKQAANSVLIPRSKIHAANHHLKKMSIFLLTPEQQNALKGGNRQVLIGPAGTGKTIIIQAKAMELLSIGEPVLIFSTESYREMHKQLFDENGLSNYELWHWPSFVGEAKFHVRSFWNYLPPSGITGLAEQIYQPCIAHSSKYVSPMRNPLYHFLYEALFKCHIFFDDSMIVCNNPESWACFLACLAIMKRSKTVWIASDLFGSMPAKSVTPQEFLTILTRNFQYSVVHLGRIMRSSEEIYRLAHAHRIGQWNSLLYDHFGIDQVQSGLGHKVQGIPPIIYTEHFSNRSKAHEKLLREIDRVVKYLIGDGVPEGPFLGVILSVDTASTQDLIYDHIIDSIRSVNRSVRVGCRLPGDSQINNNYDTVVSSPLTYDSDDQFSLIDRPIIIGSSTCVLSFEWPVVIHILFCPTDKQEGHMVKFYQYQARSRAITTFIEFFYTYDRPYPF